MADLSQLGVRDWTPLAWEIACQSSFEGTLTGGVKATVTLRSGQQISGLGVTTNAATQDLARELDRWAANYGSAL